MRLFRNCARSAAIGVLSTFLLASFVIASALYFDNLHSASIAQRMMSDAARLQINQSGFADVLAFASQYHGTTSGEWHSDPCVEADCLAVTGISVGEFWEKHPKLADWRDYLIRRNWRYSVFMWVANGKLVAQHQWLIYATPKRNIAVITKTSKPSQRLCENASYRLHNSFAVNVAPHHFNVWVDANSPANKELLRLDIGCVATFAGCAAVSDVVPSAWAHYEADQQALASHSSESNDTFDCRASIR